MKIPFIFYILLIFTRFCYGFDLLNSSQSARIESIGGGFILRDPDITALASSPAIAPEIERHQILAGFSSIFNQRTGIIAGYFYPELIKHPLTSAGASLNLCFDSIETYNFTSLYSPGEYIKTGEADYLEILFNTGVGIRTTYFWRMGLNLGANLKFLYQKIDKDKYSGAGFDINMILRHRLFVYSLLFKDIYTFLSSKEVFPFRIRTGFLLKPVRIYKELFPVKEEKPSIKSSPPVEFFESRINPYFEIETVFDKKAYIEFYTGIEFILNNYIALRTGFHTHQGFSYGAGIKIFNFSIDFAYTVHPELDKTFKINLIYFKGK